MDPNNQANVPQQTQPSAPLTNMPPQPTPASAPNTYQPTYGAPSSSLPAVIGLIVGIAVLIAVIALAYIFVFSDAARTKKLANTFMTRITKNEVEEAAKLTGDSNTGTKSFLTAATDDAADSYQLEAKEVKNGKGYFLYTLAHAKSTHARVTVEKKSGKWLVTSYVYSKNKLKLVPDSTVSGPATTTELSPPSSTACLTNTDVAPLNFGVAPTGAELNGERVYSYSAFFFQPDSTTYNFPNQMTEQLNKLKTFYESNKNKAFTIHLRGKVKESAATTSGEKLAHDRVAKVKADLVALGVPAARFVEDTPDRSAAADNSERNVNVRIHTNLMCTESEGGSGR